MRKLTLALLLVVAFTATQYVIAQQPKDVAATKSIAIPFTLEESNQLTSADAAIAAANQELADLNMKIAQAVIRREAAIQQFNEIANKYTGQEFLRSDKGVYTGHRLVKQK